MATGAQAVKTAFFVNLAIAFLKLGAAALTRSVGMAAEAVHSFADTGNQALLLVGLRRSGRCADEAHPFGYGKEEYFWSFIVAMILFILGSVYSTYEGIHKLLHPEPLKYVYVNFIILGVGVALEGYSWFVAKRAMGDVRLSGMLKALVESHDANTVVVFVEDTGALVGLGLALGGNLLAYLLNNPAFDALASVIIGILLFFIAIFLANEMRKLLVGERIGTESISAVKRIIAAHPEVKAVGAVKTMQIGSRSSIIAAEVDFTDTLHDNELQAAIAAIKKDVRSAVPEATHVYIQLIGNDCKE